VNHDPSAVARFLSVPLMLAGGALVALQSQVNSRLAEGLGEGVRAGVLAAVISFGSGLLLLSLYGLLAPSGRAAIGRIGDAVRSRRLRWYELIGGLAGAYFVAAQGIAVGTIGVALFIVAFTAGQAGSSLLVDRWGLSPGGRHPVNGSRLIAAGFALVAVVLKGSEQLDSTAGALLVPFALMAVLAGGFQSVQQAVNGRVSVHVGSFATTWNNFAVGTMGLLVLLAASFTVDGQISGLPREPWLFVGGLCGMGFIYLASWTVRIHGVLVLGLCMIAGQVVTAEIIELTVDRDAVGRVGLVGGALTLVGVLIALALRPGRDRNISHVR
jgi:transporter family-2 protein